MGKVGRMHTPGKAGGGWAAWGVGGLTAGHRSPNSQVLPVTSPTTYIENPREAVDKPLEPVSTFHRRVDTNQNTKV